MAAAPEVFAGAPPAPATDVYALGVLLLCCLSQVALDRARRDQLLDALREGRVPSTWSLELVALVLDATADDPAARPCAGALEEGLGQWLSGARRRALAAGDVGGGGVAGRGVTGGGGRGGALVPRP